MTATIDHADLCRALRSQRQIDEDGTEVAVSREACDVAAGEIERLQLALTASEKQREEAVRLLRAVGAGGIFTLMAESSDDADVWYDQRDAILKGQF